jgi:hypothetical protein
VIVPNEAEVRELADEMLALHARGGIAVSVDPVTAFSLIGVMQLAFRHPELTPAQKQIIRELVDGLAQAFPAGGPASRIIERGWTE